MVVAHDKPPRLTARGLGYRHGRDFTLQDLDFDLSAGDMVGIIGPNGSGKSTLLGLLSGLLRPDDGRVLLDGRDLAALDRAEAARTMGLVPQSPELAAGFTVLETVLAGRFALMGGRMFENAGDLAAARKALDRTGLTDLANRPAGALSGGERQRLALARALAGEPGVLLLDEPTSALDLDHQLRVMALLERSCLEHGLAVCLVSHDINLASLYCDRLLLLARGRPVASGPPPEVVRSDLISSVYGVRVLVDREPVRGRPRITRVPPTYDPAGLPPVPPSNFLKNA